MKIGVTGASGLVGYNVCKEILANGDSLNLLIREDVSYLKDLKCKKFYGDLMYWMAVEPTSPPPTPASA